MPEIPILLETAHRCQQALYAEVPRAVAQHVPTAWRDELPTSPGWYVYKGPNLYGDAGQEDYAVFELARHEETGLLYLKPDHHADDWMCLHDLPAGQWKGPLDFDAL